MRLEELILRTIQARAERRLADLAGEFARAESEEKEDILAGIEFERWLAESCRDALRDFPDSQKGPS